MLGKWVSVHNRVGNFRSSGRLYPSERRPSLGGGRHARFDSELLEDMLQVLPYCASAHVEDAADLGIGLALGHPLQHLSLPLGKPILRE